MTNEEKAKEIANLCEVCMENGHPCVGCSECEARGSYYGALEMAEWKDEQFKAYLKNEYAKVRKQMKDRYGTLNEYQNGCYDGRIYELTDIFKEYLGGDDIAE